MSNEAQIATSLRVQVRDSSTNILLVDYQSRPTSFQASVAGTFGPVSSKVVATTIGADLDTSKSGVGGLARFMNQSPTYTVSYGAYIAALDLFLPIHDILPGESYVGRISQLLGEEVGQTGTGQVGSGVTIRFKGIGGTANVLCEVFPQ